MKPVTLGFATAATGVVLFFSWPHASSIAAVSASASTTATSGTFTGQAASTRYGNVTVQITVTNGQVTDAQAIEYPNRSGTDLQINSYAVPILNSEAVKAGTANISMVSGATFTSRGYIESLQSALDQAGL